MSAADGPRHVYLFRSERFVHGGSTVICAAPADLVMAAYGGGGHQDQEGLQRAFGGNAFYRNDETGACFLGVWGARNASRFRSALRQGRHRDDLRAAARSIGLVEYRPLALAHLRSARDRLRLR